jgi:hypothetical protein
LSSFLREPNSFSKRVLPQLFCAHCAADGVHLLAQRAMHEGRLLRLFAPVRLRPDAGVPNAAQVWYLPGSRLPVQAHAGQHQGVQHVPARLLHLWAAVPVSAHAAGRPNPRTLNGRGRQAQGSTEYQLPGQPSAARQRRRQGTPQAQVCVCVCQASDRQLHARDDVGRDL